MLCQWCGGSNIPLDLTCSGCKKLLPLDHVDVAGLHKKYTETSVKSEVVDEDQMPVIGQTEDDYQPPEAPVLSEHSGNTAEWSELDLGTMSHWQDGFLNTHTHKRRFTNATEHFAPDKWQLLKRMTPTAEMVKSAWLAHGVKLMNPPRIVQDYCQTPGLWFYNTLALGINASCVPEFREPKVAYHATSLSQGAQVVASGGLKVGVCATAGVKAVYCERESQKTRCLIYATHTPVPGHPGFAVAVIFELCVDRQSPGARTINNSQWGQCEDSNFITGVFTHIFPIARAYDNGFRGWFRLHLSLYAHLKRIRFDDDGRVVLDNTPPAENDMSGSPEAKDLCRSQQLIRVEPEEEVDRVTHIAGREVPVTPDLRQVQINAAAVVIEYTAKALRVREDQLSSFRRDSLVARVSDDEKTIPADSPSRERSPSSVPGSECLPGDPVTSPIG